jgi:hypothetical protein
MGIPWYSFLEAESTPGHMIPPVATEKIHSVTPPGIDLVTFWLVAQCLNHYATPGPFSSAVPLKILSSPHALRISAKHEEYFWVFRKIAKSDY